MKRIENIKNIAIIIISLFAFSIIPLNLIPADMKNADNYNEWVTASSLRIVNSWLTDGIIKDNFVMYEDFASVEFENNNNRSAYVSYPPGSLIPLFLSARIIGKEEISVAFIKTFAQYQYYFSVLFLALFFYACLITLELKSRPLIILLPIALSTLWSFLPFNVYYMKNVFFSDQAVIPLSIIFFSVEVLLYNRRLAQYKKPLQAFSAIIIFVGLLSDYYFFPIVAVVCLSRIINAFQNRPDKSFLYKVLSDTWMIILSVVCAASLFFIQLLSVPNGLKLLAVTFNIRTGSGVEHGGIQLLAIHHFNVGFSVFSLPILIGVTIFCVIFPFIRNKFSEKMQMVIRWLSIIALSSVLHTAILREHSIVHEFSMLKYNLVFTFMIFTIIYWLYARYVTSSFKIIKKYSVLMIIIISCLSIYGLIDLIHYNKKFYNKRMDRADHSMAEFTRRNTSYYDVVYSPDYEIACNPPQDLAISRKRIYRIARLDEISVQDLPDHAIINILISEETLENKDWSILKNNENSAKGSDRFYLFKFSKRSFQSLPHAL
jgi:hypothetical protein